MSTYNPTLNSASMPISTAGQTKMDWLYLLQQDASYPMSELVMRGGIAKEKGGRTWSFPIADDPGLQQANRQLYTEYGGSNQRTGYRITMEPVVGFESDDIDEQEVDRNTGDAKWADERDLGLQQMYQRLADKMESKSWQVPGASSILLDESGIPYWVNWPSTTSTKANNVGTTPSSAFTLVGGIDPTLSTNRFNNWAVKFTDYTATDFGLATLDLMQRMHFKPPPNVKGPTDVSSPSALKIYAGQVARNKCIAINRLQNDNMGRDAHQQAAMLSGRDIEIIWKLDGTTNGGLTVDNSEPFYFINHRHLYPCFTPGWKFKVKVEVLPKSFITRTSVHYQYNWVCDGRMHQGVAARAVPFNEA